MSAETESESRKRKAIEKFLSVYTLEQLEQLADLTEATYQMAVMRETEQTLTVLFNDKGYPRGFNGSNNIRPMKPKTYQAE